MRHIIINGEKLINFVDIYYYGEKLNNYCGDKLIYCQKILELELFQSDQMDKYMELQTLLCPLKSLNKIFKKIIT